MPDSFPPITTSPDAPDALAADTGLPDAVALPVLTPQEVEPLWHWGGAFFGYRHGEWLLIPEGQVVGRIVGDRIFDIDGFYIGELRRLGPDLRPRHGRKEGRLITRRGDKALQHDGFRASSVAALKLQPPHPALDLPGGYQRFPFSYELKRYPRQPAAVGEAAVQDAVAPQDLKRAAGQ